MFIKQKRVRKSDRFSPRYIKSNKNQREVIISQYSTTLIQFALGIALLIVSYQSFVIFHSKVSDLAGLQRYVLPAVFLLAGIFCLRGSIIKFIRIRREQREVAAFYREEAEKE